MPAVSPDFGKDATTLGLAEFVAPNRHFTPAKTAKELPE
jgi:hypothetical protein